jgi:hypothetical protein
VKSKSVISTWPDVIKGRTQVSFSAETKRLQLQELTEALDWPRFSGTLTGSDPGGAVCRQYAQDERRNSGRSVRRTPAPEQTRNRKSVFTARVDEARCQAGKHSARTILENLCIRHLSGILEGSIDELVITDGQPSQFRADLQSVDRGTEQRISVEALNKITVLSSGQEAGSVYSGLAGFFDSFRYSKLGFKATLKNDRLTLRGVESDTDKEYLVVGSLLPPTVNIISHTQNIAFSELLRRLERIKSEKPEVK